MHAFVPISLEAGVRLDVDGVTVRGWRGDALVTAAPCFGMVTEGPVQIDEGGDQLRLRAGMHFVLPAGAWIAGGRGLLIEVPGPAPLRTFGGPIEARGRLWYIDGCTDSLIVGPARRGEPCLNHLHIPASTLQSAHTHPSIRVGVIARGSGVCVTPNGRWPLAAGLGWVIPTGVEHSFHTSTEALDVIAWHPDSDTGPTDEDHPMVNRTVLRR